MTRKLRVTETLKAKAKDRRERMAFEEWWEVAQSDKDFSDKTWTETARDAFMAGMEEARNQLKSELADVVLERNIACEQLQGINVRGIIAKSGRCFEIRLRSSVRLKDDSIGQRVRVLIMKEDSDAM